MVLAILEPGSMGMFSKEDLGWENQTVVDYEIRLGCVMEADVPPTRTSAP